MWVPEYCRANVVYICLNVSKSIVSPGRQEVSFPPWRTEGAVAAPAIGLPGSAAGKTRGEGKSTGGEMV